jgi:hypothetical protein
LNFWYEYSPVATDTGFVYVLTSVWNTKTSSRDTVAEGYFWVNTKVSTFTLGSVNMYYYPNYLFSGAPDTMQILVSSSSRFHGKANPGSIFWIDDITWGGNLYTGVNQLKVESEKLKVYPNPASATLTISLPQAENANFELYNELGEQMKNEKLIMKNTEIELSNEAEGVYFYRVVKADGTLIGSDKVVIAR